MTPRVTVDIAGARMGGAARYAFELHSYLTRTGRDDVRIIGAGQRVRPAWLVRREIPPRNVGRRVALNNVSFVGPGEERWTLLHNALHFLTETEASGLDPGLRASVQREATVVRFAVRRADVLIAPCTAMAERITQILPATRNRLIVRLHPLSADSIPRMRRDAAILCPVLLASYKRMHKRLIELLDVLSTHNAWDLRIRVTASPAAFPAHVATDPRVEFVGELNHRQLKIIWARSRAIYFPTDLESFGYPLAEARVSGHPVIAYDTAQNREIAGNALCGYRPDDPESLGSAITLALTKDVVPDAAPFDPDSYFNWLLGEAQ